MIAADAGADDVEFGSEEAEIYTVSSQLHAVREALESENLEINEAELDKFPKNEIQLGVRETLSVMKIIELLEDLDDTDKVYSNLQISDEALTQLEVS